MLSVRFAPAIVLVCLIGGCTSFSSTMLNRLDDGSFVGNSNGEPCNNGSARPFKGIPITLQVPTHVDVYVEETYFLYRPESSDPSNPKPELSEAKAGRILNVRTVPIKSGKVFLVDFKRPASGTLDMGATFNDKQYFDKIESKLEDTTIVDSAKLLSTVLKFATPTASSASFDPAKLPTYRRLTRVVAYRRFDINEPDHEIQLETFVNQHLNDCDSCAQPPTYDPVQPN